MNDSDRYYHEIQQEQLLTPEEVAEYEEWLSALDAQDEPIKPQDYYQ